MQNRLVEYFKTNKVQISLENVDFLRCIFPAYKVHLLKKPLFFQQKYILVSTRDQEVPDDCLFVSTVLGKNLLDPVTFIDLIWYVCFPNKEKKGKYFSLLSTLELEDLIKAFTLLFLGIPIKEVFPEALNESSTSVFDIFKLLFSDFSTLYTTYRNLPVNHKRAFVSLLSIFLKIVNLDLDKTLNISNGYLKLLSDNKKYLFEIREAVKDYVHSTQTEMDFIVLLCKLSNERFLLRM